MANIEKLETTLDYIRSHPDEHNQAQWATRTPCGTAFCFAGTAVLLAGYEMIWDTENSVETARRCLVPSNHPAAPGGIYGREGMALVTIADAAAAEFELPYRTSRDLFNSNNTLEDLELMVKNIANTQAAE